MSKRYPSGKGSNEGSLLSGSSDEGLMKRKRRRSKIDEKRDNRKENGKVTAAIDVDDDIECSDDNSEARAASSFLQSAKFSSIPNVPFKILNNARITSSYFSNGIKAATSSVSSLSYSSADEAEEKVNSKENESIDESKQLKAKANHQQLGSKKKDSDEESENEDEEMAFKIKSTLKRSRSISDSSEEDNGESIKVKSKSATINKNTTNMNNNKDDDDDEKIVIDLLNSPARKLPASKVRRAITIDDDEEDDEIPVTLSLSSTSTNNTKKSSSPKPNFLLSCEAITMRVKDAANKAGISFDTKTETSHTNESIQFKPLKQEEIPEIFPKGLSLKPYQVSGINWLLLLHQEGLNAILADEMGLGKTVQTIAYIRMIERRSKIRGPHLIIAPSSTLENWHRELKKWLPKSFRIVLYHGDQKKRAWIRDHLRGEKSSDYYFNTIQREEEEEESEDSDVSDEEEEEDENNRSETVDVDENSDVDDEEEEEQIKRDHYVDIILTSYTIFEKNGGDSSYDRSFIQKFPYHLIVYDEAHAIKSTESARYKRLAKVASKRRLLISGTPVQNNLQELVALMMFCFPTMFPTKEPLEFLQQLHDEMNSEMGNETIDVERDSQLSTMKSDIGEDPNLASKLRHLLNPFILRRLKSDVLSQLPPKVEQVIKLEMTQSQKMMYDATIEMWKQRLLRQKEEEENDGYLTMQSSKSKGKKKSPRKSNGSKELERWIAKESRNTFFDLRKIVNHPLLIQRHFTPKLEKISKLFYEVHAFGPGVPLDKIESHCAELSDWEINNVIIDNGSRSSDLTKMQLDSDTYLESAKCKALEGLLPKLIEEGHRVLLFSQWTTVLDILEELLHKIHLPFLRIDGSTPVADRQDLIDRFNDISKRKVSSSKSNERENVFLLSTRAGGLGINLTGADTVIMHDLDFNPSIDKQAEDRCHRIGQERTVTVIKLICKESIDERIFDIQIKKKELGIEVLGSNSFESEKKKNDNNDSEYVEEIDSIMAQLARQS